VWPWDGQPVGPIVLEHQPAAAQHPGDEAERLLVADLDVPVTPDPSGDGREQLLDVLLLGGRPYHADQVGVSLSP
jgi:hypothetical protein